VSIGAIVASCAGLAVAPSQAVAQVHTASGSLTINDVSDQVWSGVLSGGGRNALAPLRSIASNSSNATLLKLSASNKALEANLKKWDETRAQKLDEAWKELEKYNSEPIGNIDARNQTYASLSKALKAAVEVQLLSADHTAVLNDPRVKTAVERADTFARQAEQ